MLGPVRSYVKSSTVEHKSSHFYEDMPASVINEEGVPASPERMSTTTPRSPQPLREMTRAASAADDDPHMIRDISVARYRIKHAVGATSGPYSAEAPGGSEKFVDASAKLMSDISSIGGGGAAYEEKKGGGCVVQ